MNFPDSPSNGDTITLNGKVYTYTSATSKWSPAGGGSASIGLSDTAPVSPSAGDLWYNTDNGTMNVYYNDGSSSQWVGTSGVTGTSGATGATGPAGADGAGNAVTFVSDMAALIARTGMSAGDQALVQDTNKLFMYTGSAWYMIATMVNASPTPISGVAASYVLEKDGTATTITAISTDPEGFPLTWSYAVTTGSLGSTATVSQADNVFTITPSTDSADAGEFSITFSVTDGSSGIVNAISAFTLSFSIIDPNFNQVSFLSHLEGTDNGVNNVFTDSSVYPHAITANGTVTQGSFSPFSRPDGEWSVWFDGAGYYHCPASSDFAFGTGDFTMEAWCYVTADTWQYSRVFNFGANYGTADSHGIVVHDTANTDKIAYYRNSGFRLVSTTTTPIGEWFHIAVSKSANVIKLFYNGQEEAVASDTASADAANANTVAIGGADSISSGQEAFEGFISNARVVKGTGVYTSNFTPLTSPLTAISGTVLLTCQSNRYVDNSSQAHPISITGTKEAIQAVCHSPFQTSASYDPAVNGASAYFDSTGVNYLSSPNGTEFAFGTGDYTIDFWYYTTKDGWQVVIDQSYNSLGISLWTNPTGQMVFYPGGGIAGGGAQTLAGSLSINAWSHVALVRDSGVTRIYVNGVSGATYSDSNDYTSTDGLMVASDYSSASYAYNGYISNVRAVKGTAVYTSDFTPPTSLSTAIDSLAASTVLLLNMADGQAIDNSAQHHLTLADDVKLSTAKAKFGNTSMLFDGSGKAYIEGSNVVNFGSSDFTVEFFMNITTGGATEVIFDARNPDQGAYFALETDTSNALNYFVDSGTRITSSALSTNTWYHVAICRSGTSTKMFIDGTQAGSTFTDSIVYLSTNRVVLGGYAASAAYDFDGYLDEIRVSKTARYTTNFTAPVLEFGGQGK